LLNRDVLDNDVDAHGFRQIGRDFTQENVAAAAGARVRDERYEILGIFNLRISGDRHTGHRHGRHAEHRRS
jgi:hypothetical protein